MALTFSRHRNIFLFLQELGLEGKQPFDIWDYWGTWRLVNLPNITLEMKPGLESIVSQYFDLGNNRLSTWDLPKYI